MNMNYCRFQNTLSDFEDCLEHLKEEITSESEKRAAKSLYEAAKEYIEQYELNYED